MSEPTRPPDIPFPYPYPPVPDTPRRTEPLLVPLVEMPSSAPTSPLERLFERRTILVGGVLDHAAVTELCARLMALDGRSADPVELVVSSDGGPLGAIGAVLDVLDLMRAPVDVTCTGSARGTGAVLVACCTGERRIGRHAVVSLRLAAEAVELTGGDVAARVEEHATMRRQVVAALARRTGQPVDVLEAELDHGGVRDAEAAVAFGLVDAIVAPVRH